MVVFDLYTFLYQPIQGFNAVNVWKAIHAMNSQICEEVIQMNVIITVISHFSLLSSNKFITFWKALNDPFCL